MQVDIPLLREEGWEIAGLSKDATACEGEVDTGGLLRHGGVRSECVRGLW